MDSKNMSLSVGPPMHYDQVKQRCTPTPPTSRNSATTAWRSARWAGEHGARVSQGFVVIPTDAASPEQHAKYEEYAQKRMPRTATPRGPARMMFAPISSGTSGEIAERLYSHVAFQEINEVAFALPFTFDHGDHVQILTEMATKLGPALGWGAAP